MSEQSARLMVAVLENVVCIKVNGRADFTLSMDLEKLVSQLWNRGYRRFALELCGCLMMDSTFLGMLAGMGLKYNKQTETGESPFELFNPSPRIVEVLEGLGVADLFKTVQCPDALEVSYEPAKCVEKTKVDVTRTCLEAHKTLMALNPENVKKFKDVTQFLAEDLKRLELAEKK